MALRIPYESQAGIQNGNAPGPAASYRGASEFAAARRPRLEGLGQLAAGLGHLGGAMFGIGIQRRQELLELDLINDLSTYKTDAAQYADDYQKQYRGREAVNAEGDAAAWHDRRLGELRAKWAGNPTAENFLARHGGQVAQAGVGAMRDYAGSQLEMYKDSTFQGLAAEYQATLTDWRSTPDQIAAANREYLPKLTAYYVSKGLDPKAAAVKAEEAYRNGMAGNLDARLGYLVQTDPQAAWSMLQGRPRPARLPEDITAMVTAEAERQGIPPDLALAVVKTESGGRADAVSKAGAAGLFQLMPGTASDQGVTDPFDPAQNTRGGVAYLKQMLTRYGGDMRLALAGYNWGPGNVDKHLQKHGRLNVEALPAETQKYLTHILGDEAAMVNEFLSPGERVKWMNELDRGVAAQRKVNHEAAVAEYEELDLTGVMVKDPNQYISRILNDPRLNNDERLRFISWAKGEAGIQGAVKKEGKEALADAIWQAVGRGDISSRQDLDRVYATEKLHDWFGRKDYETHLKWIEEGGAELRDTIKQFIALNPDNFSGKAGQVDREIFINNAMSTARRLKLTSESEALKPLLEDLLKDDKYKQVSGQGDLESLNVGSLGAKPEVMESLAHSRLKNGGLVSTPTNQWRAQKAVMEGKPVKEIMAPDADKWEGKGLMTLGEASGPTGWLATKGADMIMGRNGIRHYKELFETAGNSYNVDPNLLASIAQVASQGDPDALNFLRPGGIGLMQLPGNVKDGASFDPRESIEAGAAVLAKLASQHGNDLEAMLMEYAAGTDPKRAEKFTKAVKAVYFNNYGFHYSPPTLEPPDAQ